MSAYTFAPVESYRAVMFTIYPIDDGARGIVEMLFCSSLIALVGAADQPQSSPRKLQIVNTKVRLGLVEITLHLRLYLM